MYTIHMYLSSDTCLPDGEIRREAGNRKQAGKVATFSRGNVDISGTPVEEKQVVEQARKEFRRKGKGRGGSWNASKDAEVVWRIRTSFRPALTLHTHVAACRRRIVREERRRRKGRGGVERTAKDREKERRDHAGSRRFLLDFVDQLRDLGQGAVSVSRAERFLPGPGTVRPLLRLRGRKSWGEALQGRARVQGRQSQEGAVRHPGQRPLRGQNFAS